MCLNVIEGSKIQIADEDIVVYKYLHQDIGKNKSLGKITTPYRNKLITIGKTYKSELILECGDEVNVGLHSFAEFNDCENDANTWMLSDIKTLFVKCVIPKGSHYFVGEFSQSKSYASDTLKYVEVIN